MGGGPAHRLVELEVLGSARKPLLATDDMRDLHVVVVHEHGEVIGGEAIGLDDDEVVLECVLEGDIAPDRVVERGDAGAIHTETHDRGLAADALVGFVTGGGAAAAVVAGGQAVLLLVLPELREPFRGTEAAVGAITGAQLVRDSLVLLEALRLDVGAMRTADVGALVPLDPEPAQPFVDVLDGALDVAALVGVFNTKDELPAVRLDKGPREEGRAQAADMQLAGGAGGETGADGSAHATSSVRVGATASA